MTRVKICGIKTEGTALAAAEAGADFIGLVFAPSPRQVTPAQAIEITSALREKYPSTPEITGVFVDAPAMVVNAIAAFCRLDYVQLSGDESRERCLELAVPFIKTVHIGNQQVEPVLDELESSAQVLAGKKYLFLLDSFDAEKYGGTGKSFDWRLVRPLAQKFKVIIAGGLTPDNVVEAIRTARPWGVDVSSGVETGGEKDLNKIRAFIKAVRKADER